MRNAGLDKLQAGIKIGGRNINNLRHADDTTRTAESEEEVKSLLMRVKEERERAGLILNIKKIKIMASSPITAWQIEGEKVEVVTDFLFLGSKITANGGCSQEDLLISWLESPSAVISEPKKRKSVTTSTVSCSICQEVMGSDAMILVFLIFSFKPALSLSFFILIKRLFSSSSISALEWYHLHI